MLRFVCSLLKVEGIQSLWFLWNHQLKKWQCYLSSIQLPRTLGLVKFGMVGREANIKPIRTPTDELKFCWVDQLGLGMAITAQRFTNYADLYLWKTSNETKITWLNLLQLSILSKPNFWICNKQKMSNRITN